MSASFMPLRNVTLRTVWGNNPGNCCNHFAQMTAENAGIPASYPAGGGTRRAAR